MARRRQVSDVAPRPMDKVPFSEYREYLAKHKTVLIEDVEMEIGHKWTIHEFAPPKSYRPESTTVWSFPDRGDWASHAGNYRGNWSPYIPRNLILRYTQPGDLVLDQMVGSGTTMVESRLLGRKGIGVDVNRDALMVAWDRLNFPYMSLDEDWVDQPIDLYLGDARNLDAIRSDSIDLIATHPPYAHIIKYTGQRAPGDLSALNLGDFVTQISTVATEAYRVLKPGKHCAILIGDWRQHKHYVPISARVFHQFLEAGFVLREDIIKLQHKMRTTRERWRGSKYDFYLIGHEHLFVFRKLGEREKPSQFRKSMKWWSPTIPLEGRSKRSNKGGSAEASRSEGS